MPVVGRNSTVGTTWTKVNSASRTDAKSTAKPIASDAESDPSVATRTLLIMRQCDSGPFGSMALMLTSAQLGHGIASLLMCAAGTDHLAVDQMAGLAGQEHDDVDGVAGVARRVEAKRNAVHGDVASAELVCERSCDCLDGGIARGRSSKGR